MAPMFDERERTAESIFVHDEQMRFIARRRGLETLAAWAADAMGMTSEDKSRYSLRLIEAFVGGTTEEKLAETVQTDLERAGKPALSTHVGTTFARAVADATFELRGGKAPSASPQAPPRTNWSNHNARQSHNWGWGL